MKIGRKTGTETDRGTAASGDETNAPKIGKLSAGKAKRKSSARGYLDGQMLIAISAENGRRTIRTQRDLCLRALRPAKQ